MYVKRTFVTGAVGGRPDLLSNSTPPPSDPPSVSIDKYTDSLATYYPHTPTGNVWVHQLLFVCLFVCLYGYRFLCRG